MEIFFWINLPCPGIALSDVQHTLRGAKPAPASYLQERLKKNNTVF